MTSQAPRLLVSVRDPEEARCALEGAADVIDVKEPLRGPLGAADLETLHAIAALVDGRRPISAALGELREPNTLSVNQLPPLKWVKFGLSGQNDAASLLVRWEEAIEHYGDRFELVPAAYADHEAARSLPPLEIAHILAGRYRIFLVDTCVKTGASVFDSIDEANLRILCNEVHSNGAQFALAGSLQLQHLDRAMQVAPNIVGVRGAACDGGRNGRVSKARVGELRARLNHAASAKEFRLQS